MRDAHGFGCSQVPRDSGTVASVPAHQYHCGVPCDLPGGGAVSVHDCQPLEEETSRKRQGVDCGIAGLIVAYRTTTVFVCS